MPTLTQFRQAAAREFGAFTSGTATSGNSNLVLTDATWPMMSTLAQDDLYVDYFVYRPNATVATDKVRTVKTYNPSQGQLTADAFWSYNWTPGEAYELHGMFDPNTLLQLMNDALKRCFITVEFTVPPVADGTRENITALQPWLTNKRWIRWVGYLNNSESREKVDPYWRKIRGETFLDGGNVYIWHPTIRLDPNSTTMYVFAIKPAYYHVNSGAQSGLSLESDTAEPLVDRVAAGTLVEAWRRYGHLIEPIANQRLIRDRTEAEQWFSQLNARDFELPSLEFRPITTFGPRQQSWGPFIQ
ncbi:MAG: hypothetical protein KGL39_05475 [Patescibacteria group bacterium]|nr:hypothetical protein [Patescibacteria group bacterium]